MFKFLWRALFRSSREVSRKDIEEILETSRPRRPLKQAQSRTAPQQHTIPKNRQAAPFDPETAHPPRKLKVIEGSAYVTDGDTIVINKTQIRIFGVDAPELNHPYGQKAKWAMVKLCKGQTVRAEITDEDTHGRMVARCYLPDGRDLSAEMVKQGLAIDWPKFSGGTYSELETVDARKRLWLASARQKGHMHVWQKFEAKERERP